MTLQILFFLFTTFFIPLSFILWLWRALFKSKFDWLMLVLLSGTYILLIFLVGSWSWLSYYVRFLFLALYIIGTFISFWRCRTQPVFIKRKEGEWVALIVFSLATFLFTIMLIFTLMGYSFSEESIRLEFPLKNGQFYIAQGGNSPLINNHHHPQSPLKFALDITKLYSSGNRANGIYPDEFEKYAIYENNVYSPCNGLVIAITDSIADSPISEPDTTHFKGNFIKLQSKGIYIYLAHLKDGSIKVNPGDTVESGQLLARVSNSGYSTEPHLHIHAEIDDSTAFMKRRAVAILFQDDFLIRNDIYTAK